MTDVTEADVARPQLGHGWKHELTTLWGPTLGVGIASGALGFGYGSVTGVLIQSSNPRLYTALSSVQFGITGSVFFFGRTVLLNKTNVLSRDIPSHRVMASGLAGSLAGIAYGAFQPQAKGVQSAVLIGSLSLLGQLGLNAYNNTSPQTRPTVPDQQRQQQSKSWNPFKSLTDEEYQDILQSKLLRIKAEISMLDDRIADLNRAKAQQDAHV